MLDARPPIVLVIWRDAFFDFDQHDADDVRDEYLVHTTGFLIGESERFVHVASEILPDGDGFRAVSHVPQSCVEEIVRLEDVPQDVPRIG